MWRNLLADYSQYRITDYHVIQVWNNSWVAYSQGELELHACCIRDWQRLCSLHSKTA